MSGKIHRTEQTTIYIEKDGPIEGLTRRSHSMVLKIGSSSEEDEG